MWCAWGQSAVVVVAVSTIIWSMIVSDQIAIIRMPNGTHYVRLEVCSDRDSRSISNVYHNLDNNFLYSVDKS